MMTPRLPRLPVLLVVGLLMTLRPSPEAQGQALAFRNVTLIDGTGTPAAPGTTVVVVGNRITPSAARRPFRRARVSWTAQGSSSSLACGTCICTCEVMRGCRR